MKWRHAIIAVVTFVAGLYFILDFVVPPTVPVVSRTGVFLDQQLPVLTVLDDGGREYRMPVTASTTVEVLRRDTKGEFKPRRIPFRRVRVGTVLTVQTNLRSAVETEQGMQVVFEDLTEGLLPPGAPIVGEDGTPIPSFPADSPGMRLELANVRVSAIDFGTVNLLIGGRAEQVTLTGSSRILRLSRTERPVEVAITECIKGDTVRIGPNTLFSDNRDTAAQFNAVIESMALGLGLLSLAVVNSRKLVKRNESDWYTAIFFFMAVVFGVFTGLYRYYEPGTAEKAFSDLIVTKLLVAIGSTIFSLLAFYMASAAYRAFRVKTAEAALMMGSSLIVMLGQTPFGTYLTRWLGEDWQWLWLPNVAGWILRQPNSALVRALLFGVMLGAIATAIRYWLSLERSTAMRSDT